MSKMEQEFDTQEAEYFGLAETWDQEIYSKLRRDRNIALGVAGVAALLAGLSIIAVMMLTPLKTVEPYMIMVDKTTGHAEAVRELVYQENNPLTERESFVIAEINNYIIARHTFDPLDAQRRALSIQMSTAQEEYRDYRRELNADANRFNASMRRTVEIKSIVPNMTDKSAQVRFATTVEAATGDPIVNHWIATLNYDFVQLNMPLKYRYLNPLGFIVTQYRVDPETLQ